MFTNTPTTPRPLPARAMDPAGLETLITVLRGEGYEVLGPTPAEGAIVYDRLASAADLPVGWADEQAPGHYRLYRRQDAAYFGYVVGPHSWKKYLFPPRETLFYIHRRPDTSFRHEPAGEPPLPRAFLGVRPCELAAIASQDIIFNGQPVVDRGYAARRGAVFTVAVDCAAPGGTCFCTSAGGGPTATGDFDLALSEICHPAAHFFAVAAGSAAGEGILAQLETRAITSAEQAAVQAQWESAPQQMGRELPPRAAPLLKSSLEHPRWEAVAKRCLSCANCTLVCPTCFCSNMEDTAELDGSTAARVRTWGSCFEAEHSYLVGGPHHASVASRYRQWLTHKLAHWHDQFGHSGCTGCGRCITWCPVGIDLTEEVAALAEPAPEGNP
ncbi:MAG: 4Fe-4S dicluster domain-containing protein [Desulfurivibrio sp.]|nr:4Fe-4S dicluster domain-containing protein [Desulfurivibrio sp.]